MTPLVAKQRTAPAVAYPLPTTLPQEASGAGKRVTHQPQVGLSIKPNVRSSTPWMEVARKTLRPNVAWAYQPLELHEADAVQLLHHQWPLSSVFEGVSLKASAPWVALSLCAVGLLLASITTVQWVLHPMATPTPPTSAAMVATASASSTPTSTSTPTFTPSNEATQEAHQETRGAVQTERLTSAEQSYPLDSPAPVDEGEALLAINQQVEASVTQGRKRTAVGPNPFAPKAPMPWMPGDEQTQASGDTFKKPLTHTVASLNELLIANLAPIEIRFQGVLRNEDSLTTPLVMLALSPLNDKESRTSPPSLMSKQIGQSFMFQQHSIVIKQLDHQQLTLLVDSKPVTLTTGGVFQSASVNPTGDRLEPTRSASPTSGGRTPSNDEILQMIRSLGG